MRSIRESFETYAKMTKKVHLEMVGTIASIEDPSKLADVVIAQINAKLEDKQKILEICDVPERMETIYELMLSEIEILQVEEKIKRRVKKQMEKTQKDYYLNEQMRAIQKEMGEKDEFRNEIAELEKRLKQKKLSEEAHKKVKQEIKKMQMMAPMSAEATVVRNYIDWLLDMPWAEKTENKHTLKESEAILEEDHYGLKQVKERIIEYLAVQTLVKKNKGPILCLVGPPGVGKTSIAKSVARATNRKFVRLSLGGVRDEAEIRGHRRTYIGAMPGKIIQLLKKAGTNNPVFCLDEVDKLSSDFRGDPSSALLEVLDPEQNNAFNDNYLEVDYDLSDIMFITTANVLQTIPAPLAGPDGGHPSGRLYGAGKTEYCQTVPCTERDGGQRTEERGCGFYGWGFADDHPSIHPGGGGQESGEGNRLDLPEGRQEDRGGWREKANQDFLEVGAKLFECAKIPSWGNRGQG